MAGISRWVHTVLDSAWNYVLVFWKLLFKTLKVSCVMKAFFFSRPWQSSCFESPFSSPCVLKALFRALKVLVFWKHFYRALKICYENSRFNAFRILVLWKPFLKSLCFESPFQSLENPCCESPFQHLVGTSVKFILLFCFVFMSKLFNLLLWTVYVLFVFWQMPSLDNNVLLQELILRENSLGPDLDLSAAWLPLLSYLDLSQNVYVCNVWLCILKYVCSFLFKVYF